MTFARGTGADVLRSPANRTRFANLVNELNGRENTHAALGGGSALAAADSMTGGV